MADIYSAYEEILPKKILEEVRDECKEKRLNSSQVKKILDKVKQAYENAIITPGEAIGIITAESIGEPGTQMCNSYDEKVILKYKNNIKVIEIGKFVNTVFNNVKTRKYKSYEVYNIPEELLVLGLNQQEKLKWVRVLALNRVKSPQRLIKIKTKSGRSITATDFHSFVTRKNNRIISIAGKDLKLGDRIPVLKYLPENCNSHILVNDYIKNTKEVNGLLTKERKNVKSIPNLIKLDGLFGWFVGAYLAEGNCTKGRVCISNLNDKYIENARGFTSLINLNYKEEWHHRGFAQGRDFKISSTLLASFIKQICGTGSAYKKVPDFAYSANDEFVAGLLRGYFDGDGNFTVDRKMIRVSSNSKELADGIALLLSRFKIFSYKTKDKKGQYWLLIPYKYAPLYLEFIGSDIDYKLRDLEKMAELAKKFWNVKSQDYNDMISGFGDLFYRAAKKLGYRTRYINNFTKRQKIGRTALYRYIKIFENLSKEKNIDINKDLGIMKRMFNSDVVWDEIIDIKYVKPKHKHVYDLSVPGLETFTTFDGIVTHNTLNTFHFAGVAELNVTVGLPRLIEIFDARKTPSTPRMTIYLKQKYAHDPKLARKMATQIKETKLKEIATEFSINLAKSSVEVKLDYKRMKELELKENDLINILSQSTKNVTIKMERENLVMYPKLKEYDLGEVFKLKEKAKESYISGVKGITQVLPIRKDNEFIVLTAGSNLKDILKIDEVDEKRTVTNDIQETEGVLGIEAARQAIIDEALKVIEDQGLDINIRHLMFLADVMTVTGSVKGITRSGITSEKESVLARASFETPIKHIINAALVGEHDPLNSVVENVILNQPVPLGTGLPVLTVKSKKTK